MAWFTVLVVTDTEPSYETIKPLMQPYQDPEALNYVGPYMVSKDVTKERIQEYHEDSTNDSLEKWLGWEYGYAELRSNEEPDYAKKHSLGYFRKDEDDNIYEIIDRDNPNRRFMGWTFMVSFVHLPLGEKRKPDSVLKGDLDLLPYTYAILHDGMWVDEGSHKASQAALGVQREDWPTHFKKYLDSLPETAWVSALHCMS